MCVSTQITELFTVMKGSKQVHRALKTQSLTQAAWRGAVVGRAWLLTCNTKEKTLSFSSAFLKYNSQFYKIINFINLKMQHESESKQLKYSYGSMAEIIVYKEILPKYVSQQHILSGNHEQISVFFQIFNYVTFVTDSLKDNVT